MYKVYTEARGRGGLGDLIDGSTILIVPTRPKLVGRLDILGIEVFPPTVLLTPSKSTRLLRAWFPYPDYDVPKKRPIRSLSPRALIAMARD